MSKAAPKHRSAQEWATTTKGVLKAELKLRDMTYADLAQALAKIGVRESEPNLRNKISRGRFSAAFLLQCFTAIGARSVRVPTE
jgi:hypothetical protein